MEETVNKLLEWIDSSPGLEVKYVLDYACRYLRENMPAYSWVGVYVVRGEKLKLYSYAGEATEHVEIKIGDGLCSLAILKNSTVNEPDVKSNSEYLACFPTTESELVVPVISGGKPVGEIDIDSDAKSAFGIEDERLMARLAEKISGMVASLSS